MKTKLLKNLVGFFLFVAVFGVAFAFNFGGGISGGAETTFDTNWGLRVCAENGTAWAIPNGGFESSLNKCTIPDVKNSEGNLVVCCPRGFMCNSTNSCVPEPKPISKCSDYTTKQECNNYNLASVKNVIYQTFIQDVETSNQLKNIYSFPNNIIENPNNLKFCDQSNNADNIFQIKTSNFCRNYLGCGCYWNVTSNTCGGFYNSFGCDGSFDDPNNPQLSPSECRFVNEQTTDLCATTGYFILNWTKLDYPRLADGTLNMSGGRKTTDCNDGSRSFGCPAGYTVPFFTMFNFVIALGLVVAGYLFFKRK